MKQNRQASSKPLKRVAAVRVIRRPMTSDVEIAQVVVEQIRVSSRLPVWVVRRVLIKFGANADRPFAQYGLSREKHVTMIADLAMEGDVGQMGGLLRQGAAFYRWLRRKLFSFGAEFVHPRGGPVGRTRRRIVLLVSAFALTATVFAMPGKMGEVVVSTCNLPVLQPQLSDACGSLSVKGVAVAAERQAWAALEPGNCEALDAFVAHFPKGVHRPEALARLSRNRGIQAKTATPRSRKIEGYVRQSRTIHADEVAAIAEARQNADSDANRTCAALSARLIEVQLMSVWPSCSGVPGGFVCGADYTANCVVAEQAVSQRCD